MNDFVPFCMDMACFIPKELIGLTSHHRVLKTKSSARLQNFQVSATNQPNNATAAAL